MCKQVFVGGARRKQWECSVSGGGVGVMLGSTEGRSLAVAKTVSRGPCCGPGGGPGQL